MKLDGKACGPHGNMFGPNGQTCSLILKADDNFEARLLSHLIRVWSSGGKITVAPSNHEPMELSVTNEGS